MIATAGNDGIIIGQAEFFTQQRHHFIRHIALINKAHRLSGQTLFQGGGHQLQHPGFHFGGEVIFRIARHFHGIGIEGIEIEEALEDFIQAVAQNIVDKDHRLAAAAVFGRQINKTRHFIRRNFQQRIAGLTAGFDNLHHQIGVIVFEEFDQIGAGLDHNRRDVLAQMLTEILTQPDLLFRRNLAFVDQENLVTCHFQQQVVIQGIKCLILFCHFVFNFTQQMAPAGAGTTLFLINQDAAFHIRIADFIKLIQVI